ncbi:MAG: ABC transporter ATP-binding protein [Chlorobi bacterium]|nr:ABC transporter ATP-binding protein [Chlorobiota bacterium]
MSVRDREIAIEVRNLWKTYVLYHHIVTSFKEVVLHFPRLFKKLRQSRFEVLKDVSFEVRKGEVFGIMGHNGAGKSTLLALIAGVIKPDRGTIKVKGRISPLLELGAGFHPELTGRENIILNGLLLGLTKREIMQRFDKIVEFSELGHFIEEPIRIYSSGMVARLGFSVAVHTDPDILLVDEVLAVGDANFQQKCLRKMEELRNNGVTMVFVSHSRAQMEAICDRIMTIDHGRVVSIEEINRHAEKKTC